MRTGWGALRLREKAQMSRQATSSRYRGMSCQAAVVRPFSVMSSERFWWDRVWMKRPIAPTPLTAASRMRHSGSFFGLAFALSSSGSGSGGTSSGSSGDVGSIPPQAAITSLGVTASGSSPRAIRLADVV